MKNKLKSIAAIAFSIMLCVVANPTTAHAAPAPQLTSFKIVKVASQNGGIEAINNSSTMYIVSTSNDHGGTWLEVTIEEIGYAGYRQATFNGNSMTLISTTPIDNNNDSIIDGYECTWRYSSSTGFTNGTFTASSKSVNYPYTTKTISYFNIK